MRLRSSRPSSRPLRSRACSALAPSYRRSESGLRIRGAGSRTPPMAANVVRRMSPISECWQSGTPTHPGSSSLATCASQRPLSAVPSCTQCPEHRCSAFESRQPRYGHAAKERGHALSSPMHSSWLRCRSGCTSRRVSVTREWLWATARRCPLAIWRRGKARCCLHLPPSSHRRPPTRCASTTASLRWARRLPIRVNLVPWAAHTLARGVGGWRPPVLTHLTPHAAWPATPWRDHR